MILFLIAFSFACVVVAAAFAWVFALARFAIRAVKRRRNEPDSSYVFSPDGGRTWEYLQ